MTLLFSPIAHWQSRTDELKNRKLLDFLALEPAFGPTYRAPRPATQCYCKSLPRGIDCAALEPVFGPSPPMSLIALRGRAAHSAPAGGVDCAALEPVFGSSPLTSDIGHRKRSSQPVRQIRIGPARTGGSRHERPERMFGKQFRPERTHHGPNS